LVSTSTNFRAAEGGTSDLRNLSGLIIFDRRCTLVPTFNQMAAKTLLALY
jgi:hypothetical protein